MFLPLSFDPKNVKWVLRASLSMQVPCGHLHLRLLLPWESLPWGLNPLEVLQQFLGVNSSRAGDVVVIKTTT